MLTEMAVNGTVEYVNAGTVCNDREIMRIEMMLKIEAKKGNLTPHSFDELKSIVINGDGVCAVSEGEIIGFVGYIHWSHDVELVCLVVAEEYRNKKIATTLTKKALRYYEETYAGSKGLIAFTNSISGKILEKNTFFDQEKNKFNLEVWEECDGCVEKADFPRCHCRGMVYKPKVSIKAFSLTENNTIESMCKLYCEVWREAPWNESWKEVDVKKMLVDLFDWPQGCITQCAFSEGQLKGFSWGKFVTEDDMKFISSGADFSGIFKSGKNIFYISELAVGIESRSKGLGKAITNQIITESKAKYICLRTDQKAYAAEALYKSIGFVKIDVLDKKHVSRAYWLLKM